MDEVHCGAEKNRARVQATRRVHRVRCTDVRCAIGKTIAENLSKKIFSQILFENVYNLSIEMAMRTFDEMK